MWDPIPDPVKPSGPDPPWPDGETLPRTYHPVPDIACLCRIPLDYCQKTIGGAGSRPGSFLALGPGPDNAYAGPAAMDDDSTKVGLGLWNNAALTLALEAIFLITALWIYLRDSRASSSLRKYGMAIFVALLISMISIQYLRTGSSRWQS